MKNLIKQVALDVARTSRFNDIGEATLMGFAEAFLAELSKRAEAVAHLRFWAGQYYSGHGDIETDEGLEVTRSMQQGDDGSEAFPVFTFPPIHDIEAIENRVAEACAACVADQDDVPLGVVGVLRQGGWKEYK